MKVRIPRQRPASIRRTLPVLVLLALVAGVLFAMVGRPAAPAPTAAKSKGSTQVGLRRDAANAGKPLAAAAAASARATTTQGPRKQRARVERERAAAPESKV